MSDADERAAAFRRDGWLGADGNDNEREWREDEAKRVTVTVDQVRAAREYVNEGGNGYLPVGVGEAFLAQLGIEVERERCPYTFAHTRTWCGHPECREA